MHIVITAHSWGNQLLSTVHSQILPYTIILQPINRPSSLLAIHTPKPEEEWQEASSSSNCRLHTKPKPSSIMLLFFHNTTTRVLNITRKTIPNHPNSRKHHMHLTSNILFQSEQQKHSLLLNLWRLALTP
ncbi:hypothetical protein PRUPE_4G225400 [Prunus persica]|uniref:Uncharacterized protein n=1 Tax=Prunus persica TaxID=3760 RepID=A0A251PQZ2_PRUPE|nr:hypothetical protein PRUPE_4G225400 [Prunus persica]